MDKLVNTNSERRHFQEAYRRDCWVKAQAQTLPSGSRVLDAGAGASKYQPYFAHCRYETQDFCKYGGELVKYLKPLDYICEITSIPLEDGCLDAILCTEVLEHVVDPMAVLKEFSRLLKPGGRLFLTAPMLSFLHMEPYHYYGGFTQFWYKHWLPRFGFTIQSIAAYGGPGQSYRNHTWGFFQSWSSAECSLTQPKKAFSKVARFAFKLLFGIVPQRLFPKWDGWLSAERIASGWMVAAQKQK
jgi:SAM-dependent methyltransferase